MDETYEQDSRTYVNPEVSPSETNTFIENLRATQDAHNAEIAEQTHNLGSDLPSGYGGLSGSGGVFKAQYQTPQVNEMVAGLQATAQANALNTAMENYQAQVQKQYDDAYQAYQDRQKAASSSTTTTTTTDDTTGDVDTEENSPTSTGTVSSVVSSVDLPEGAVDGYTLQDGDEKVVSWKDASGNQYTARYKNGVRTSYTVNGKSQ